MKTLKTRLARFGRMARRTADEVLAAPALAGVVLAPLAILLAVPTFVAVVVCGR